MAGFQKIYTSENEYLYDLGKTTGYFDEEYYNLAKESGSDYQYLQMMASLKQTGVSNTFDPVLYSKLSGEERFNYLATENFMDKSSEDYTKSSEYFRQREKQIQNEEIYASLNGFEKTMNSIGGWLGNAFLQVGGIVEGLIDAAIFSGSFLAQSTGIPALMGKADELAAGTKELIGKDTIGYNAAQASMNDWINKYTFIDKNVVTQAINDVTTGIVRMAPMSIPGVGQAGAILYYGSMMGNTAEQAIMANPDINYGNLLLYTAGSVGLEALTEWASGKLFGDDLISSLMKGQKYAPTGTIVKTIAKNFGTEALEEAVAEIFGSLMYAELVTGNPEDIASIKDIFYAAIIGGLTGAVMSGKQIVTTKRMVVTQDGQLKYRSELTDAELKTAKKLKLSESWGLQSLIQQSQQALSTPDNVTQLMAETGKSVSQLQTENANEYEKAVAKDTETKTQQAKAILDLANLMSTIGVEQFTKSAELLKNNADLATEYVNNFLNHTDVANKKASEVFSANYPGKSFTPTAIPSKPNQALAEALRQAFPQLKVVFGTFGSEDGLPVRAINKGETYLFLDENMVSQKGYQQVLHETIRYQLADQLMQEINILNKAEANGIVKLVTDLDVNYDKLTKEQKLSIAQILCFDPVNSRRLFKGANKTHAKIFNYITDQSEYVKKFGRQTEANKMRYHDLLEIRNMYIKNIAETISNNEDVQTAKEQYTLTDEETKTKIIDKTENTILNDTIAVMRQNLDKNVIARQEAIEDLLQNRVETNKSVPFDWSNLYNEEYYNENWVAQIKQQQQTQDFHEALRAHLLASHKVDFSIIEHSTLVDTIQNNVTIDELNKLAETLFTKEYLDTNPDLQVSVADALYTMVQTEDTDADSIMTKDNQIQGTGKLKFLKVKVDERNNIYNDQQQGQPSEGAREQVGDVVTKSTTIANKVTINEIDKSSYNDRLREIVRHAKREYGANVHFYSGSAKFQQANIDINDGLNGFVVGIDDIYLRYDETTPFRDIEDVLLHEGTHILIAKDPNTFKDVRNKLRDKINERVAERNREEWMDWAMERVGPEPVEEQLPWDKLMAEYSSPEMYGDIYDKKSDIEEELVVDLLSFRTVTKERSTNGDIRNIAYEYYATTKDDMGARRKYATKTRDLSDVSFEAHEVWDRTPYQKFNSKYAVWKQSTLDKLIERFGRWDNDSYTSAYVAYINPVNFVANSTQGALERTIIRQGLFEPDNKKRKTDFDDYDYMTKIDETVKEDNVPRFWINTDTMEITGHEGRHRNYTFDINNIENVPVLLIVDEGIAGNDPLANRMYKNVTFKGQQQSITEVDSPDAVMFGVMVPLNESHRTELEKMFVKGDMGEPKIRFAKTTSKKVSDFAKETKNVSKKILQGFAAGSKALSQVQYSESNSKEYYQVSRDMIDTMADTFALVNNENYDQIRKDLENSIEPYAKQALEIFDFYTIEMQGKFNAEIRQKIENQYQKLQTEAGQRLYLQSVRVAERKPISSAISTLQKDGFNVTLTDEMVLKYDAKLKDKDAYIKELESRISDLEKQIKQAKTEIEKAALSKELKDVADKKLVIESGSNADIMDYIVRNTSTLEEAAKIQDDILQKLVSTAVKAQEEGKKVGYYVYDENGELKPFPEASKKLAKTLKKLKSFRMWAMLSSPVTWVRNWIGNQGMRALDSVTNVVEGFMNKRFGGYDQQQMKFTETKGGKELYEHIAKTNESYIMALVRGEDVKYETTAEKAAAIKRQERKIEYDSANAFQKLCLKAQDMTDWGLSTGFLGDEPVVFNSICKNMGNLVANNIDFLLQGIRQEVNSLNQKTSLTEKQKTRLDTLEKALSTKNSIDVFNALSKEETERLFDVCKERSFQQYFKNPNALSKWFSKFGAKHPVYAELVSWVMPFPKVASNVLSMAYRYSPLNFFNGLAELSKYRQTQQAGYKGPVTGFERAKAVRAFSEASVGTFMLIAGAIFSAMGLIDIDEDDYMGPSIKIGDFKISLTNLAPSMTTFSTAAAMVWAWKNDKSGVTQALSTLYDNTLLGNVENLLTYGSLTDVGKNAFMSYISQYIPAILKLVNKTTTGGVKKDKSGTYLQRLIKTLFSYVPGVSTLMPDKIDPYTGEKMYQAGSDNWFLNLLATISPLTIRWDSKSEIQRQAEILGAETTGLSGSFKINDVDYSVSNKEKYAKYRANYIESQFDNIVKGKQEVTVEDENGKRITTTYDKLNDKQKKNVINRLYTEATTMTKIKWWIDQGNIYVVTNRDQYNEYRKMFNSNNIIYKKTWTKSKFVES